jgi:hypothetical protein
MKNICVPLSKEKLKCLFLLLAFWFLPISINAQVPVFLEKKKWAALHNTIVNGQYVPKPRGADSVLLGDARTPMVTICLLHYSSLADVEF